MCGGRRSIVRSGLRWGLASARDRIGGGIENQGNVRRDLPSKCRKIAAPEFVIFLDQIVTSKSRGVPIRPTILQALAGSQG
jgi:hypothetical protein